MLRNMQRQGYTEAYPKLFLRREIILVGINASRRWTATFRADSCSFSETSLRDNCKKVHIAGAGRAQGKTLAAGVFRLYRDWDA